MFLYLSIRCLSLIRESLYNSIIISFDIRIKERMYCIYLNVIWYILNSEKKMEKFMILTIMKISKFKFQWLKIFFKRDTAGADLEVRYSNTEESVLFHKSTSRSAHDKTLLLIKVLIVFFENQILYYIFFFVFWFWQEK